jgi:hypothetical protein
VRRGIRATALMSASFVLHPRLAPPPKVVACSAARRLGISPEQLPRPLAEAYWIAAHVGFGISLAVARRLLPAGTGGIPYGTGVWLANYVIALPALRLYPTPARDNSRRAAASFAAHLIFGAVLRATRESDRTRTA